MGSQRENLIWVLCPSYRDVVSFTKLRENIRELYPQDSQRLRFVLVDDTAGVDPEVSNLSHFSDVLVLTCPFNLGHQRAIVFGLRSLKDSIALSDIVVTMDSDGEDKPEDLPRLIEALKNSLSPYSITIAQRVKRKESLTFKGMYLIFKLLFTFLTGEVIRSGNFACFRGRILQKAIWHPNFDLCYSSSLVRSGLPLTRVPCDRGFRYAGQSRMTYSSLAMHGVRMLMPFLDRISIRALMCFAVTFTVGTALSLGIVGLKMFTDIPVPYWATNTLIIFVTLSFVALGNFLILFALFSQSQGLALNRLDKIEDKTQQKAAG